MISYKITDEFPKDEESINKISFDDFFEWINDKNGNDLEKSIFTNKTSGLNSLLKNIDKSLDVNIPDIVRRYEILKLLGELFYIQESGNHISKILNRTSYRSLDCFTEEFKTEQSEAFNTLYESAKAGMEHQEKSKIEDMDKFKQDVPITQNKFVRRFNAAAAMIKRVYSYKGGKYFTEKYNNIMNSMDQLKDRIKTFSQNTDFEYTAFELFYQKLNAKQAVGANHSQYFIADYVIGIIDGGFIKISDEVSCEYKKMPEYIPVDNLI